jgi:hypothetical protein
MESCFYIGIDAGLQGAISVIDGCNGKLFDMNKVPIIKTERNNKNKTDYNIPELYNILSKYINLRSCVQVVLELQRAMPGQGTVSMFSTGAGFGLYKGLLYSIFKDFDVVDPKKWQNTLANKYLSEDEVLVFKENNYKTLITEIKNEEFLVFFKKMIAKKSITVSKIKSAYIYYKICESNDTAIDLIKYSDNNIVDAYLISYYCYLTNHKF